jgi:hypothetical protein
MKRDFLSPGGPRLGASSMKRDFLSPGGPRLGASSIRVIYYSVSDPFWGAKLIEKVAENILSAIRNPEEAIFKGTQE